MELSKFIYDGKSIPDACAERNASFEEFDKRFKRMRNNKTLSIYSDEYLIDYIFRNVYPLKPRTNSPHPSKYFVDDAPLADFARQNGVLSFSVRGAVQSALRKNPDLGEEDTTRIAKEFVARNKNKIVFMYDNYPLSIALRMLKINRSTIMNVFYEEYPDHKTMTQKEVNDAIKDIVDAFKAKREKQEKAKGLRYEI